MTSQWVSVYPFHRTLSFVPLSLCLSASLSLWVSGHFLFPNILPETLGSRAVEAGAVGTGQCPVLTKDNKGRKGLEPRPGAD